MSGPNDKTEQPGTVADQLRNREDDIWALVESQVIPKVVAALRRQFGSSWRWLDLSGVVLSAQRSALRRLQARSDPKLEDLETLKGFENWLVVTARNKFLVQLRHAGVEEKHAPTLAARHPDLLDGVADETATQVVQRLRKTLSDQADLAIFDGKYAGKTEVEIGNELGWSTRKVRSRWQDIREQLCQDEDGESPPQRQ
jgi:DNA-directed RNA polymerase specialized sigma24 family protein